MEVVGWYLSNPGFPLALTEEVKVIHGRHFSGDPVSYTHLIVQARIPKVVIGSRNPKAGCAGSVLDLLHVPAFNHQVELEEGVLKEECSELLVSFFRELRQKKKANELTNR